MKFFVAELAYFQENPKRVRNVRFLVRFLLIFLGLVTLYSIVFHLLMAWEGQRYSWITGVYWTLTVMSTLGFGDITFHSDLGRLFSMLVLGTGMIYLLVLLPFTFIEFFYAPWMEAQSAARAPRKVPEGTAGHVILTRHDPVTRALIKQLQRYGRGYVLLVADLKEALDFHDDGIRVVVGELDDPESYRRLEAGRAALVATTAGDTVNTNVAFTVRETFPAVPILATANDEASVDILEMAGCNHVLRLGEMMGGFFARRAIVGRSVAQVVSTVDGVHIAEATVAGTPLAGETLASSQLRRRTGITVVGIWQQGELVPAAADTLLNAHSVLILAGTQEQLGRFEAWVGQRDLPQAPVVILGGGRVGRATGRYLAERDLDYRIVERNPERIRDRQHYVEGNAAELEVLKEAGVLEAPTVIVTTHDDDTNVYLTIYCRRLRPDAQILSRSSLERNVSTLYRAGADVVLSYATMGAAAIFNTLHHDQVRLIAEGLSLLRLPVPAALAGVPLSQARIRETTGCSVVAVKNAADCIVNPDPEAPLPSDGELLLIGGLDSEERFLAHFGEGSKSQTGTFFRGGMV